MNKIKKPNWLFPRLVDRTKETLVGLAGAFARPFSGSHPARRWAAAAAIIAGIAPPASAASFVHHTHHPRHYAAKQFNQTDMLNREELVRLNLLPNPYADLSIAEKANASMERRHFRRSAIRRAPTESHQYTQKPFPVSAQTTAASGVGTDSGNAAKEWALTHKFGYNGWCLRDVRWLLNGVLGIKIPPINPGAFGSIIVNHYGWNVVDPKAATFQPLDLVHFLPGHSMKGHWEVNVGKSQRGQNLWYSGPIQWPTRLHPSFYPNPTYYRHGRYVVYRAPDWAITRVQPELSRAVNIASVATPNPTIASSALNQSATPQQPALVAGTAGNRLASATDVSYTYLQPETPNTASSLFMHPLSSKIVLASWYYLPGRRTSSREWYNANAFTVASREYPLGSLLLVTDPESGRWVKARVNDRGPYVEGRGIDVTLRMARWFGMIKPGVKYLRVELLPPGYTRFARASYGTKTAAFGQHAPVAQAPVFAEVQPPAYYTKILASAAAAPMPLPQFANVPPVTPQITISKQTRQATMTGSALAWKTPALAALMEIPPLQDVSLASAAASMPPLQFATVTGTTATAQIQPASLPKPLQDDSGAAKSLAVVVAAAAYGLKKTLKDRQLAEAGAWQDDDDLAAGPWQKLAQPNNTSDAGSLPLNRPPPESGSVIYLPLPAWSRKPAGRSVGRSKAKAQTGHRRKRATAWVVDELAADIREDRKKLAKLAAREMVKRGEKIHTLEEMAAFKKEYVALMRQKRTPEGLLEEEAKQRMAELKNLIARPSGKNLRGRKVDPKTNKTVDREKKEILGEIRMKQDQIRVTKKAVEQIDRLAAEIRENRKKLAKLAAKEMVKRGTYDPNKLSGKNLRGGTKDPETGKTFDQQKAEYLREIRIRQKQIRDAKKTLRVGRTQQEERKPPIDGNTVDGNTEAILSPQGLTEPSRPHSVSSGLQGSIDETSLDSDFSKTQHQIRNAKDILRQRRQANPRAKVRNARRRKPSNRPEINWRGSQINCKVA